MHRAALTTFLVLAAAHGAHAQVSTGVQVGHATGISLEYRAAGHALVGTFGVQPWEYRMSWDAHLVLGQIALGPSPVEVVYGLGGFAFSDADTFEAGPSGLFGVTYRAAPGQSLYVHATPRFDVWATDVTVRMEAVAGIRVELFDAK